MLCHHCVLGDCFADVHPLWSCSFGMPTTSCVCSPSASLVALCYFCRLSSQVGIVERLGWDLLPFVLLLLSLCLLAAAPAYVCVVIFFCVPLSVVCNFCTLGVLLNLLICNSLFVLMKTCYARLKKNCASGSPQIRAAGANSPPISPLETEGHTVVT
jgi:hypothetical protein